MSKPRSNSASRKRPPRTPPSRPSRSGTAWPLWGSLAVVAVLGVVTVVWLAGRPNDDGGQPASGGQAVGEAAPAVRLPSTTGQTVDLAGFRGKRNVLLYFYEHAG